MCFKPSRITDNLSFFSVFFFSEMQLSVILFSGKRIYNNTTVIYLPSFFLNFFLCNQSTVEFVMNDISLRDVHKFNLNHSKVT